MASVSLLVPRLARVARSAYGIVAALGAAAIWGWVLGVPALRDLGADYAAMSPGAALAVMLLATSFFAAEGGRPRSAAAAAAGAGAIAACTLVESLSGVPLGMNFVWLAGRGAELPGTMSIAACITLLLLALVTPLARDPNIFGAPVNALAALGVGTVAFFALLGLSLRVLRFDLAAPPLGFSAPAAIATMLAAVAIAASRPSEWLLDTLSSRRTRAQVTRWLLPAAMVVPIAVGWMRLYAEREGVFGEAFGMTLFTLVMIAWFSSLIIWVARTLDQAAAQRAQAEGAATEQREWLQVTLASIGDGVVATDAAGRVRFLNAAAQRLTAWRAAEAAGRPLDELFHLFDERDGAPLRNPLNPALATRRAAPARGEPAPRARDGAVHPVTVNAAPILDGEGLLGAVLVLREVAAQRQSERAMREAYTELDQRVVRRTAALGRASPALRRRNALLNAITTSTPDLIFAKDRQGRLLMANPAWSKAVGKTGDEAMELDDNERIVLEAGRTANPE